MPQTPDSHTAAVFIPAANFTAVAKRDISHIVFHDMESSEGAKTARNVANWFGQKTTRASAHYNVDAGEIVQCVREHDVAWHAPGLSHASIGVEHAGKASQTLAQWTDPYSMAMLKLSATLHADLCARYYIPIRFVDAAGLLKGVRGITTHAEVTKAFKRSTHTDPGKNFPMKLFIGMVQKASKS